MNLRTEISERLWGSISSAYDAGNYAHAVLEAVHVITETLREKSGLDGDGHQLVGQALGGENPKVRLNSLQTDTERNIQKGFESILRGVYSAIRNPRSHESASDNRAHADAIICFVNYLVSVLDASKEAFTPESFMVRVADPDFVDTVRYSELIVNEIPPARFGDALIAVYKQRKQLPLQKRGSLVRAMIQRASETQLGSLAALISDELRTTNDPTDIRTALQFMTADLWPRLAEPAKLRIENKLLTGMRTGKVLADGSTNEPLSTWARDFLHVFATRDDAASILRMGLYSEDSERRHFIAQYFFDRIPYVCISEHQITRTVDAIARAVRAGNEHVRLALVMYIDDFPEGWRKALVERLQHLTDTENPAIILADGTPFLSSPTSPLANQKEKFDDDIPF